MLYFATPRTAEQLLNRLTSIESCGIRDAWSPERLEWIRQNWFQTEGITKEAMAEVKAVIDARFAAHPMSSSK